MDRVGGLLATEGVLTQLLFLSRIVRHPTPAELVDLVLDARSCNAQHRVTGVLLHKEGALLHAVEGPESGIVAVYQQVVRDYRHTQVTALANRKLDKRQYGALPLSFHNLDELEESGAPSVRSFASIPLGCGSSAATKFHGISII